MLVTTERQVRVRASQVHRHALAVICIFSTFFLTFQDGRGLAPGDGHELRGDAQVSPTVTPVPTAIIITSSAAESKVQEHSRSSFGALGIIILFVVNLAGWFVFWVWIQRRLARFRDNREKDGWRLRNYDAKFESLDSFAAELDHRLKSVERQPERSAEVVSHPGRSIEHPQPLRPPLERTPFSFPPEPETSPVPSYALAGAHSGPSQDSVVPPQPVLTRTSLGEAFVTEVRRCVGEDAPIVWERFFAKLRVTSPGIECGQVYWDRAVKDVHFRDQAPSTYSDTGTCWRLCFGNQSLLFFRALIAPARQIDLPGCRIVSSDKAVLDPSKLIQFTPPIVIQDSFGWRIEAEGDVRYQ